MPELKRCDDSPSFGSLKAFELIGRLGGIRKAAIALGVDHAAVSRHLKSLEEWAPAATSKSPTRGRVKIPHLAAAGRGMITRCDAPWQDVQRIP